MTPDQAYQVFLAKHQEELSNNERIAKSLVALIPICDYFRDNYGSWMTVHVFSPCGYTSSLPTETFICNDSARNVLREMKRVLEENGWEARTKFTWLRNGYLYIRPSKVSTPLKELKL